jgi:hypothetical protein
MMRHTAENVVWHECLSVPNTRLGTHGRATLFKAIRALIQDMW